MSVTKPMSCQLKILNPANIKNLFLVKKQLNGTSFDYQLCCSEEESMRRYHMRVAAEEFDKYIEHAQWRLSSEQPLVKGLYLEILTMRNRQDKFVEAYFYTEHFEVTLQDLKRITLPEFIYIMKYTLLGFQCLKKKYPQITVSHRNIGLNSKGQCKVWLHQNFTSLEPEQQLSKHSHPFDLIQNIMAIFKKQYCESSYILSFIEKMVESLNQLMVSHQQQGNQQMISYIFEHVYNAMDDYILKFRIKTPRNLKYIVVENKIKSRIIQFKENHSNLLAENIRQTANPNLEESRMNRVRTEQHQTRFGVRTEHQSREQSNRFIVVNHTQRNIQYYPTQSVTQPNHKAITMNVLAPKCSNYQPKSSDKVSRAKFFPRKSKDNRRNMLSGEKQEKLKKLFVGLASKKRISHASPASKDIVGSQRGRSHSNYLSNSASKNLLMPFGLNEAKPSLLHNINFRETTSQQSHYAFNLTVASNDKTMNRSNYTKCCSDNQSKNAQVKTSGYFTEIFDNFKNNKKHIHKSSINQQEFKQIQFHSTQPLSPDTFQPNPLKNLVSKGRDRKVSLQDHLLVEQYHAFSSNKNNESIGIGFFGNKNNQRSRKTMNRDQENEMKQQLGKIEEKAFEANCWTRTITNLINEEEASEDQLNVSIVEGGEVNDYLSDVRLERLEKLKANLTESLIPEGQDRYQ